MEAFYARRRSVAKERRRVLGIKSWEAKHYEWQHKWAGHVARLVREPDRITWQVLTYRNNDWLMQEDPIWGCQGHGRRFRTWRWEGHLVNHVGPDWLQKALDKSLWHDGMTTYVDRRMRKPPLQGGTDTDS